MIEYRISAADNFRAMHHSISLDILLALSRERHAYLMRLIYDEEEKAEPDQAVIDSIMHESFLLPQWGSLPDEDHIDAEIEKMKAILIEQRKITWT